MKRWIILGITSLGLTLSGCGDEVQECIEHYCDNVCDKVATCFEIEGYQVQESDKAKCFDECVEESQWETKDEDSEDALRACEDANDYLMGMKCSEIFAFIDASL